MGRAKRRVLVILFLYGAVVLTCMVKPPQNFSFSERRRLNQMPDFSVKAVFSGRYAQQLETYAEDQFPFRDQLRFARSAYESGFMRKMDVNGIYETDGTLCAMEYPEDEKSLERAAEVFRRIYERSLKETDAEVYFSVIPDKNYFFAGTEHLSMDYDRLFEKLYGKMDFMTAIPIEKQLTGSDYYRTDSHWRQEKLVGLAEYLIGKMGGADAGMDRGYRIIESESPFYGVYYGQAALPVKSDVLRHCMNPVLEACSIYDHEKGKEIPLYDLEKASGRDAYEMFAGGSSSLVEIVSPKSVSEKELVLFGDSFARSLAPLLAGHYRRITIYDIRYLPGARVSEHISFTDQDVLFLYNVSVLNHSITLK